MVKKIEKGVTYISESVTDTPINRLSSPAQAGVDVWLSKLIEIDDHPWISGGGFGEHRGLFEAANNRLEQILPECNESCSMDVELRGAGSGRGEECRLILSCNPVISTSELDAESGETACLTHHQLAVDSFGKWVIDSVKKIGTLEDSIKTAMTTAQNATAELRDIV